MGVKGPTLDKIKRQLTQLGASACREQVMAFVRTVQQKMVEAGIDRETANEAIRHGFAGYRDVTLFRSRFERAAGQLLEEHFTPSDRGVDNLGRILVEVAFVRCEPRLLFDDDSEQEEQAREIFTEGVIPRQLVRYFLVAVRGTVDGLEAFDARPVLFAPADPLIAKARELADSIVASHQRRTESGRVLTDWEKVHGDPKAKKVCARLLGEIHRRMKDIGSERLAKIFDNLRLKDESAGGQVCMDRYFRAEDFDQLVEALRAGAEGLRGR